MTLRTARETARNPDLEIRPRSSRSGGQRGISGNPGGRLRKKPITEFYASFAKVQISELPARIRKKFKDCRRSGIVRRDGRKIAEKVDLTIDVNRDVVERLKAARTRLAKREPAAGIGNGKPIVDGEVR